jgi:hypothetical protein
MVAAARRGRRPPQRPWIAPVGAGPHAVPLGSRGRTALARLLAGSPPAVRVLQMAMDRHVANMKEAVRCLKDAEKALTSSHCETLERGSSLGVWSTASGLADWLEVLAGGGLPCDPAVWAFLTDPRRGLPLRLRLLGSLLERLGDEAGAAADAGRIAPAERACIQEGAGSGQNAVWRATEAAQALAAHPCPEAPTQCSGSGSEKGAGADEQRVHALLVAELTGELLVGQLVPLGDEGGGGGAGGGGGGGIARPPQQGWQGRQRAPRKLPGLLAAAGCWRAGCMRASHGPGVTQACAGCGLARYCCPGCQYAHWPLHRAQCLRWREQLGGGPAKA